MMTHDDAVEPIDAARIERAREKAQEEFWAVIAKLFPELKSGDFGPEETLAFDEACDTAIRQLLCWNIPPTQQQEARLAELRARAGESKVDIAPNTVDPGYIYAGLPLSDGDVLWFSITPDGRIGSGGINQPLYFATLADLEEAA